MKKQFYKVKQLADQTFSRSGKEEALTDELQTADRKVEHLRNALQLLSKRLSTGSGGTQGQDPAAREKRLKKLPEYLLGLSMCEASNFDDDESIMKYILHECGKTEKFLANEIAEHELKVEQLVCSPLSAISDQDLPAIMKAKKHLSRLINEKESAANKYHHLERQKEENPAKLSCAKDELEEVSGRVEAARDALAADMFALVAKEAQLAHTLLQYVKLQRAYHESALHSLQDTVPELERFINDSAVKPVFGFPLEEHLRVTGRSIALPLELCVCTLHELALNEEGLFRITGSSSKVRRMKLSLDAGLFAVPVPREYRDAHVVAAVLKGYLRELPEPLLTYKLYEPFRAASALRDEQPRLHALWEALHMMPKHNYNNLRYLIKFLSALTKNQNKNKMTPSNLAIVIAPNLLWPADETSFDMNVTAAVNVVVEALIKHADWFFKEDVPFFITVSKEELLPDLCEYGFTGGFAQGLPQTAALQPDTNGECGAPPSAAAGRHSRSNSHDTSLILLDNSMKKAQSNSSLSDQSSPPHGSPKPITRRKNKPLAPVPPNFTPDKSRRPEAQPTPDSRSDVDKPSKPPRPVVSETGKVITGVQTINRSTYKQSKALREEAAKNSSRENLADFRRQSLEFEKEKFENLKIGEDKQGKDRGATRCAKPSTQPPPRPVAAPRTLIPVTPPVSDSGGAASAAGGAATAAGESDVTLRLGKPVVPERPATLRPQSFRAPRASLPDPEHLELTHIYSVDKHQPQLIQVGGGGGEAAAEVREGPRATVQRTHSSGGKDDSEEARGLSSMPRQLSHSEGNITESEGVGPASGAGGTRRPPRPSVPAPPPPASVSLAAESTNL